MVPPEWAPPEEIELWQRAAGLGDLGELMARWLEGAISYRPGYGAPSPADETTPLAAFLAACNRAGLITNQSQPGQPIGDGSGQRAWVEGFADEETAGRIWKAALPTDLLVMCSPPDAASDIEVAVTLDEDEMFTRTSGTTAAKYLRQSWEGEVGAGAVDALCDAWQVTLIDPVWGRNDLLWATLAQALEIAPPREALRTLGGVARPGDAQTVKPVLATHSPMRRLRVISR